MKKKIVAILLCVFVIGTIGISLVACNDNNNDQDKYVGTYVAYVEGEPMIQCYVEIQKPKQEFERELYFFYIKVKNGYADALQGESYAWYTDQKDKIQLFANANWQDGHSVASAGEKLFSETYTFSSIENNKFTLSAVQNGKQTIIHCKRTDLDADEWKELAYKDGTPYYTGD